jgi:hypothetical protein
VPFLHGVTDKVFRDKARTMFEEELLKDGRSGRDIGRNRKVSME